ncbi:hypothetical protein OXX59_006920 [Metschnikowia pulcherrima]
MDLSPGSNGSLPEPSVSEDGTFCESINDTVSRLEADVLSGHEPENAMETPDEIAHKVDNDAHWEQKSEFVDPACDISSLKSAKTGPAVQNSPNQDADLLHEDSSDVITANETPKLADAQLSDKFAYNNHNESIFDDYRYFPSLKAENGVVKFDVNDAECINHATLKALLVQLTSPEVVDYNLICDFFLTYRTFTDPHTVLGLLITRLVWSLQYINSRKAETEKLGKLVLLRTFVVMRHWILNYFFDDFESDDRLCDSFSYHLNQITCSGLITSDMQYEVKILSDLKTHWLSQLKEFYGRSYDAQGAVFATLLPMSAEYFDVKRLTKSNTEASIHTNPSFRRSAMLSLYDQKTHHKVMVYDGSTPESALPISNLVNQHKSSRMSLDDKIKEFSKGKKENIRFTTAKREPLAPKHNHMNLKDSSLALKKTTQNASLAKKDDTNAGFSTNGRVKLPSARVSRIVPLSPVKKMRCSVKEEKPAYVQESDEVGRKKSIKRIVEGWTKSIYSPDMHSEKSTFSPNMSPLLPDNETAENMQSPDNVQDNSIGDRIDVLSARIVDELEFMIRYYVYESHDTITETEPHDEVSRATIAFSPKKVTAVLLPNAAKVRSRDSDLMQKDLSMHDISELNIEKIDNLFSQNSIGEHTGENSGDFGENDQSLAACRNSHSHTNRASRASKRSSFGGRIASINWNDDGNLFLENSASLNDTSARPETRFYDVSADRENIVQTPSKSSSDLNSSELDQYDAEVSDLGIAMSPQSLRRKQVRKMSIHEQFSGGLGKKTVSLSRNSTDSFKHESIKSYMSYDSALSASSEISRHERYSSHLKKKTGCHDLRRLAEDNSLHHSVFARLSASSNVSARINRASLASQFSKSSSAKKSTRLSTLCALTELPFSSARDSHASLSTRAFVQDDSGKLSDLSVSSVFSNAARERPARDSNDASNKLSSASVAIPGISNNILRELASIPDESFSSSNNPIQSALYKLEGKPGKRSERGQNKLQEKGDFSFEKTIANELNQVSANDDGVQNQEGTIQEQTGPAGQGVQDAGSNGENDAEIDADTAGNIVPETVTSSGEEDDKRGATQDTRSPITEHADNFQNTEDILDAINNAATEDVIGYSSDIEDELRKRPITPIKTRSKSFLVSQTNSNANALYPSIPNSESGSPYSLLSPKLVLDGYYLASENLAVGHVMTTGSHVSFVLSYDSMALAEHFTIIERDMMQEIDWKELIELKWNKDLTPVNSWLEIIVNDEYYNVNKGVNLVIARFNLVVNWIISEILLTKKESERREIISRFIHVAYHSYEMQNYSTLMQVILALTSEKVNRLKQTWNNLNPGDILTLKHLEHVTSPLKNFVNMRVCTNQIRPSKGCIPFVGLYLSDLIFNAERPKFVKPKKEPAKNMTTNEDTCELSVTQGDSTMGSNPGAEEKMINFSRFRTSVHIVKSLSQSIEWSQNYNVTVDDELLRKCLYIKSLDEGEMNFCLEHLER